MQINTALDHENENQAKVLRGVWYPNTTSRETRDAFLFNDALDRFDAKFIDELPKIIARDKERAITQRMLTIKTTSNKKLEALAASIGASKAATFRSIIAFWVDKVGVIGKEEEKPAKSEETSQLLMVKIALLEKQLTACTQTLKEIKELTK